jgi:hypothetical protein
MNKSEQREVHKAVNAARVNPHYAAATITALSRATAKRSTLIELRQLLNDCDGVDLMPFVEVVNGCYVAKQPAGV